MTRGIQIRAARALLGLTQEELASLSDISLPTIKDFERGIRVPRRRTLRDLRQTLEGLGIQFLDADDGGVGVMLSGEALARQDAAKGTAEE